MSRTALILATGPTAKEFPVGLFQNRVYTIGVNDAYRMCPWLDVLYGSDYDWWKEHTEKIRWLDARKISVDVPGIPRHPLVTYFQYAGRRGWAKRPAPIFTGHNSGYAALSVAFQLGFNDVLLAGFDMGATGNSHFFGDHENLDNHHEFEEYIEDFRYSRAKIVYDMRVRLVTQPSGLSSIFDTVTVEEALNELPPA